MRNKDHHLLRRGQTYSLRYDIPTDLRECFPSMSGRTVFEALGTSDKVEARKRRDRRLRELEQDWYKLRQTKKRGTDASDVSTLEGWAAQVSRGGDGADIDSFYHVLSDAFGRMVEGTLRQRGIPLADFAAYEQAAIELKASPDGARLARALEIAKGKATPISTIAAEWLKTKAHLNSSSLYTYKKALAVLQEDFQTVEEVSHRDAQNFIGKLLQSLNKRTVGQYLIAYRGVWKHLGRPDVSMWSTEGKASVKASTDVLPWSDEEYLELLEAADAKGYRDLWLAIRIAAHSGAAAQGLARLDVRDGPEGRSIYLHETKKGHRPRLIPCHPEIHNDVVEWQSKYQMTERSLSRKFGRLKVSLGHGRDKVFHSFRHSVANKLENAQVMDREIQRLLGHKIGKISFDTYNAQGLNYAALSKVVSQIMWPAAPYSRASRR